MQFVVIFLLGFTVFGSFTYTGTLLKEITGYNILIVGLVLSLFGVGTVLGGKIAPNLKAKFPNSFLATAGVVGFVSLVTISRVTNVILFGIALLGFGLSFIFIQSTLIATAQEKLPQRRGTAMSLASFNMFVGGVLGTSLNGFIIGKYGTARIFINASVIMLVVGILATLFVVEFRKKVTEKNS